jgi:hypothetical protein
LRWYDRFSAFLIFGLEVLVKRLLSVLLLICGLLAAAGLNAACNGGAPVTSTLVISADCDGGGSTPLQLRSGANVTINAGVTVSNDAFSTRNGDPINVYLNSTNVNLTNYGTIYTGSQWAITVNSGAVVDSITNFGTIQSGFRRGIVDYGTINTVTNVGMISAPMAALSTGSDVLTLNNRQGLSSGSSTPLFANQNPSAYNVIIDSPTSYGQLQVGSQSGVMAFNIYGNTGTSMVSGVSASSVSVGTYSGVLQGFSSLTNVTGATGTYGGLSYSLVADGTTPNQWNLVFTAISTPSAVPTLSEWAQLMLGLMVIGVAWHFHNNRENSY